MNVWMSVLKSLTVIMFGSSSIPGICVGALLIAGLYRVFQKCGLKGWCALIPCYREYALGRCAGMETEGKTLFITRILMAAGNVMGFWIPDTDGSSFLMLPAIIIIVAAIVNFIYSIRVTAGLAEVFGKSKAWAVVWAFVGCIAAAVFGFNSKFQPRWKVEEIDREAEEFFSGARAQVMDQGLTVNLEERSVLSDFLKKKCLLRDIHLYIKPGSMVLLLGGSGSGKTTLVNAIIGYEKAKAEVVLNGRNVYREYKKMQYEVGFVPQQDLMRGNDTIIRTLTDAATLRLPSSFSKTDRDDRIKSVMDRFGLLPSKDSMVEKVSGGQRKRVSIAMEFISNPALFILDEPDSGLDGVMARELMEQLRQIANQGKIVIVITHTPDRVIDLFDSVIVLARDSARSGRLAFYGNIDEARKFFERDAMEKIVRCVNPKSVGGEDRADEFIRRFAEVKHG